MADTTTPLGTINMWHRSTDLSTLLECPAKYALGRVYDYDAGAGYFLLGTAAHSYFSERLGGRGAAESWDLAATWLLDSLAEAEMDGREIRWTKKRPADTVFDTLRDLAERFDVSAAGFRDRGMEPVMVEHHANFGLLSTTIDSVWTAEIPGLYTVIDWKTGSTAKAGALQLYVYNYAVRHDPTSPLFGVGVDQVNMAFHHVAFSKTQHVADYPGDSYMESLFEWATQQKTQMRATGFAPAHTDWFCDYCLYKSHCPAWGGDLAEMMRLLQSADIETTPQEVAS